MWTVSPARESERICFSLRAATSFSEENDARQGGPLALRELMMVPDKGKRPGWVAVVQQKIQLVRRLPQRFERAAGKITSVAGEYPRFADLLTFFTFVFDTAFGRKKKRKIPEYRRFEYVESFYK